MCFTSNTKSFIASWIGLIFVSASLRQAKTNVATSFIERSIKYDIIKR